MQRMTQEEVDGALVKTGIVDGYFNAQFSIGHYVGRERLYEVVIAEDGRFSIWREDRATEDMVERNFKDYSHLELMMTVVAFQERAKSPASLMDMGEKN